MRNIIQMVRLYKDPNGETVFTAHEEGLQVTAALGGGPQVQSQVGEGDMESLKKKIQLLEAIVLEYKVRPPKQKLP